MKEGRLQTGANRRHALAGAALAQLLIRQGNRVDEVAIVRQIVGKDPADGQQRGDALRALITLINLLDLR